MEKTYYTLGEGAIKLWFTEGTPRAVAEAIQRIYQYSTGRNQEQGRIRVRVWYGDTETGRAWLEEYDVTGYIGRSTGSINIPLLIHNSRSYGGPALLTSCIVKIQSTCKNGRVWYEHPGFDAGTFKARSSTKEGYTVIVQHRHSVREDWKHIATFDNWEQADRYTGFMTGRRMAK